MRFALYHGRTSQKMNANIWDLSKLCPLPYDSLVVGKNTDSTRQKTSDPAADNFLAYLPTMVLANSRSIFGISRNPVGN